ncbi:Hydroxyethylthiazole kinase [Moelleriella libera RCEF 2490]|uniref:Hydroxyethylthiazole kinase n=1 Tax=Moelleriella libera RCEF 2490 TaxID=1081109 RepID=A0A168DD06_9HYPO|nr:Hydroxyethylthiazole kinase [Moelleriella libera RCEF 2490]
MPVVDYSLYLVTDSTPAILGSRKLEQIVEAALAGGVTVVQYRDKHGARADVVAAARALHRVAQKYRVPLLINDRVDVAVEVGCEGVHIGQDDMGVQQARQLLGPDKIIGVTASSVPEALAACAAGADYLGIGTVYATPTIKLLTSIASAAAAAATSRKRDTKSIIGPAGVSEILHALRRRVDDGSPATPTVCIGGINASNAASVLAQTTSLSSSSPSSSSQGGSFLDGIAVVSAIMASPDPASAARNLASIVMTAKIPRVVRAVAAKNPLSHNMTNLVVQNFAANVALAVGASPIMSTYAREAPDLAAIGGGGLLVNMGTVTPDGLDNYVHAIRAYNAARRPIVFDPVGAGATTTRRQAVQILLSAGSFAVIKGNYAELATVSGASNIVQHGVDSSSPSSSPGGDMAQRARLVRRVARQQRCVAVLTGATDLVSDGHRRTVRVDNGHELLGAVTGTGCTLGTTLSAMVAAYSTTTTTTTTTTGDGGGDAFVAAVAGTVLFGVAAEMAAARADVHGPGTFVPAFLDELYRIRGATERGDLRWLVLAKVAAIPVEEDGDDDHDER